MTSQEQEEQGLHVLGEAFKRWNEQPPALVQLSKISVYQLIMGLQLATRHPDVPPASRKAWESIGQQLTEAICDNPEIYVLTQAGWNPDFDVDREEPADIPVRRLIDGRWQTVEVTLSDFRANEGADGRQPYRVKPDALDAIEETEEQPSGADATADPLHTVQGGYPVAPFRPARQEGEGL